MSDSSVTLTTIIINLSQLSIFLCLNICCVCKTLSDMKTYGMEIEDSILKMLKPRLASTKNHRCTVRTVGYKFKLQRHVIVSQYSVHLIIGGFPMGNQAFIRATKFTGLVAWLLKQGQPGTFFPLTSHTLVCINNQDMFLALKCQM